MAFQLTKMKVELGNPIQYTLKAESPINMNELIGKKFKFVGLETFNASNAIHPPRHHLDKGFAINVLHQQHKLHRASLNRSYVEPILEKGEILNGNNAITINRMLFTSLQPTAQK